MITHAMRVEFLVLQLHKPRWVKIEIVDVDLLRTTRSLWLVGSGPSCLHVVPVILIDRVIPLSLSLGRLDPDEVLSLSLQLAIFAKLIQ